MILSAKDLSKEFPRSAKSSRTIMAVHPLSLEVKPGEIVEITGRSGSGKSTLLNMLAGMLTPTSGSVLLDDTDIYSLDEKALARLRNKNIGLIPQGHTALISLSVLENVLLPYVLYNKDDVPEERAKELLKRVGIDSLMDAMPNELSGGELRRMAIARAMLMNPAILLADEPTAGLDNENTTEVLKLLREAANDGAAVLLVTHESEAAEYADRVLTMDAGKISG